MRYAGLHDCQIIRCAAYPDAGIAALWVRDVQDGIVICGCEFGSHAWVGDDQDPSYPGSVLISDTTMFGSNQFKSTDCVYLYQCELSGGMDCVQSNYTLIMDECVVHDCSRTAISGTLRAHECLVFNAGIHGIHDTTEILNTCVSNVEYIGIYVTQDGTTILGGEVKNCNRSAIPYYAAIQNGTARVDNVHIEGVHVFDEAQPPLHFSAIRMRHTDSTGWTIQNNCLESGYSGIDVYVEGTGEHVIQNNDLCNLP